MSLVSIMKLNKWYGKKCNYAFISADSRVSNEFMKGKTKIKSRFDGMEKVVCVSPNIIIGIVGEYSCMNDVLKLKEYLNFNGNYKNYIGFLKKEIKDFLVERYKSKKETDILMILRNFNSEIIRFYKLSLPVGTFVELYTRDEFNIHSIGSTAEVRNSVKQKFGCEDLRKNLIYNGNSDIDNPITISNLFQMSLINASIQEYDVGGYFTTYYMDKLKWGNMGYAISYDGGEHFISSALNNDEYNIQVNGRNYLRLSKDSLLADEELRKRGSR